MSAVDVFTLGDIWPAYVEIIVLMFSSFLIGYFASLQLNASKYKRRAKKLEKDIAAVQSAAAKDLDVIFTEIEPKIIEVIENRERKSKQQQSAPKQQPQPVVQQQQQQQQKVTPEPLTAPAQPSQKDIAAKARQTYQAAIEKKELNFDTFGYASESDKDDLTKITGVGPYIEQKLNEIGIYTYDQVSRLNWEDIQTITELIDFFPGRMERDNWVGQAEALKKY
jgi:predicted flap endonuclease-1-like 5' DNA nuclease